MGIKLVAFELCSPCHEQWVRQLLVYMLNSCIILHFVEIREHKRTLRKDPPLAASQGSGGIEPPNKKSKVNTRYGVACKEGKRRHGMEDVSVEEFLNSGSFAIMVTRRLLHIFLSVGCDMFAIFDGNSGDRVSKCAARELPSIICKNLEEGKSTRDALHDGFLE